MPRLPFPRRQQFRRLRRAAGCAVATIALAAGTILAAVAGQLVLALLLGSAALGCGVRCWSWVRLAGRSRVGARSKDEVQRALAVLEREGWRMRHSRDQLVMALRIAVGTRSKPRFLSPTPGVAPADDRLRQSVPAQCP